VAQLSLEGGKRKSYTAKTRQEAQRKLAEARRDYEAGLPVADDRLSVGRYLATWLETMQPPVVDRRTWERYEQMVRLHLAPEVGTVRLSQLSGQRLQVLYAAKLAAGLSTTTVHHLHSVVHKALEAAVRLGIIARNVADLVDAPPIRSREMHPLTLAQVQALFAVLARTQDRLEALYILAVSTGMRQGELFALRWADVELDGGLGSDGGASPVLRVRRSLQENQLGLVFKEPKTRRSRRQIALSEPAVEALRRHRVRQHEERLLLGAAWGTNEMGERLDPSCHDLVFCSALGRPLRPSVYRRRLPRLLELAGLPRVRFHDLRHTCATLLLAARVNPKVVSEMLGHSTVAITLDIYSHVVPDMQQDAAAVMGAMLMTSLVG
jgi:integrase